MIDAATYSETVTGILRRNYGQVRHASKLLARAVGTTPRTVENWFAGINAPRGAELIRLMQQCDDLRDEIFRIVGEGQCQKALELNSDGADSGSMKALPASSASASF
ncbi:hypothetical protein KGY14_05305 [Ameyamaea chiangmaiensis]|uniref:HTH cro/C1-type domain-containing protein n=1 Tax=Ameyamaea chiangmaiensis TaxID=442969 RepID=A0A850PBP4_9PROT|nr:hypothetical protein [Ameyamaea chiangmaiensis]MBS4074606.1 hypothetical protein [Ameyamaea chiangmaiensis]NVN39362.1 hypothetical protein [Ameyamaea chiangmaiensis]